MTQENKEGQSNFEFVVGMRRDGSLALGLEIETKSTWDITSKSISVPVSRQSVLGLCVSPIPLQSALRFEFFERTLTKLGLSKVLYFWLTEVPNWVLKPSSWIKQFDEALASKYFKRCGSKTEFKDSETENFFLRDKKACLELE